MTPIKSANDAVRSEWLNELSKWLLGAAAAGAGTRALKGVGDVVAGNLTPRKQLPPPLMVPVPYRVKRPLQDEEPEPTLKSAFADFLTGGSAESTGQIPLRNMSYMFGVPAAAVAGWTGIDKLLQWKRKRDLESELGDTQDELYKAELGKYTPVHLGKNAAECRAILTNQTPEDPAWQKVAAAVDKLTKVYLEKRANSWGESLGGSALNWYLPLAAALAGGSGSIMYNYARHMDPERMKAKALKEQLEESERNRLPGLYAKLVPVEDKEPKPGMTPMKTASELEDKARVFVEQLLGTKQALVGESPVPAPKTPASNVMFWNPPVHRRVLPRTGPIEHLGMREPQLPPVGLPGAQAEPQQSLPMPAAQGRPVAIVPGR